MSAGKVTLPSGATVGLWDPKQLPVRRRRPIMELMGRMDGRTAAEAGAAIDDYLVIGGQALIVEWSLGEVTEDTLLDLPVEDADALLKALMPLLKHVAPDFSPDGADDPDSPTSA